MRSQKLYSLRFFYITYSQAYYIKGRRVFKSFYRERQFYLTFDIEDVERDDRRVKITELNTLSIFIGHDI